MVSKLYYHHNDPMSREGFHRGSGFYYRRVYRGRIWWSRYLPSRDLHQKHDLKSGVGWRWQHTCDRRVTPRGRI